MQVSPPPASHSDRPSRQTHRRGFALLVTITLLALLVLLLVSLASLTRVETQVASNTQQLSQARQNALMALNIALGQLQKYAGPDQRVTATADIAGAAGGARLANNANPANTTSINSISNGLNRVQPGTRYWTGIWGNSDPSDPSQPGTIYAKTPSPVLLNWLVSGNEQATFTASTAAGTFGQVTASNGGSGTIAPAYNPNLTITRKSDGATLGDTIAATDVLEFSDATRTPGVLLIGAASTGDRNTNRKLPDANGSQENYFDRYVVAPLVVINASKGSVPGLDSNATPVIGRYAYWVGDEGVKAKYNLTDTYTATTNPSTNATARYRLLSAQRNGIEQIGWLTGSADSTYFANYPGKTTNNLPPATTAAIENTLLPGQMLFSDTSLTNTNLKKELHHLTTYSKGVLADSYNGGLRRDLTSDLEATALPAFDAATPYEPAANQLIIPSAYSPTQGPKWDVLKSFYQSSFYKTAADANTIEVQPASATQTGISPVITQARFAFGLKKSGNNNQVLGGIVLMLGNPYTATLKSTTPVSFTVHCNPIVAKHTGSPVAYGSQTNAGMYANSMGNINDPTTNYKLLSRDSTANPGSYGLLDRIEFTINNLNIPPGETVCYTNTQTTIPPSISTATGPTPTATVPLTPTTPPSPLSPSDPTAKYFEADTGKPWTPQTQDFKVVTTEQGNANAVASRPQFGKVVIDFFLKTTSGTLTSVTGSDMNNIGGSMILVPKDGDTPGFAKIWIFKLRPPEDNGALTTTRDWRTYCDYNIRAQEIIKPWVAYHSNGSIGTPPYEFNYSGTSSYYNGDTAADTTGNTIGYWGRSSASPAPTTKLMQLFDAPRANRANGAYEIPVLSLGQLQHANLTADDEHINVGHQPGNAVGNSYFNPYVTRANAIQSRPNVFADPNSNPTPPATTRYFDISYLLNCSLWDRYFFSTTPPASTNFVLGSPLPNNRLKIISSARADLNNLQNGRLAASNLLIDGAFNINSTSIDAWSALLASSNKLCTSKESPSPVDAVFARSWNAPNPTLNSFNTSRGKLSVADAANGGGPTLAELKANEAYSGYRRLTPKQINVLAKAIVTQVRTRGPFVSLAHFINRTLAPTTEPKSLKGPLQAAIDTSGLNGSVRVGDGEILTFNGYDKTTEINLPLATIYADAKTSTSDWGPSTSPVDWGAKSTGIPGWLTQADILQSLGPVLAARSDTFVIRTYGETRNPLDTSTTSAPLARAWCEAVVQRLPEYVNATDAADKGNEKPSALATDNQTFGRRFKVVSFRWLSPTDI